jgi:hypothetical protein
VTIKERPLIDAVSNPDPLPGLLTANAVVAGVFCTLTCAAFGAIIAVFQVAGRGEAVTLEVFNGARIGAMLALGVETAILGAIGLRTLITKEEADTRGRFIAGAALGAIALAATDFLALDATRAWLADVGPIV